MLTFAYKSTSHQKNCQFYLIPFIQLISDDLGTLQQSSLHRVTMIKCGSRTSNINWISNIPRGMWMTHSCIASYNCVTRKAVSRRRDKPRGQVIWVYTFLKKESTIRNCLSTTYSYYRKCRHWFVVMRITSSTFIRLSYFFHRFSKIIMSLLRVLVNIYFYVKRLA